MKKKSSVYTLAAGLCLLYSLSKAAGNNIAFAGFDFDGVKGAVILPNFSQTLQFSPIPVEVKTTPLKIVPSGLWNSLKAPDEISLETIQASFPQWDIASIREVPLKAADAMIAEAIKRHLSALDFFTNPSWETAHSYYFSQTTLSQVMAKYNLHALVPADGQSLDGLSFHMKMALIGNGQVILFMDQDGFNFTNSDYSSFQYNGHPFTFGADRVIVQKIVGPGDLKISGLRVNVIVNALIQPSLPIIEARKISPSLQYVQTSLGGGNAPLFPMEKNSAFKKP